MQIHNPILTGSFTVNGVDVSSITGSSTYSASFASQITSLNAATASLNSYTSSATARFVGLETTTASLNTYTSSNTANITSLNSYTSSATNRFVGLEAATSSLNSYTSSATARFIGLEAATASLYTATASFSGRVGGLEAATASLNTYTSSNTANITSLNSYTSSATNRFVGLEAATSSLNTFTSSIASRVTVIESKYATTGSNIFIGNQTITGSLLQSGSFTSTGTITAQMLVVQTITSSVVYSSGSNIFGNTIGNTQTFTGSVLVTGSLTLTGPIIGSSTACFSGTLCANYLYSATSVVASDTLFTGGNIRTLNTNQCIFFKNAAGDNEMTIGGTGNLGIGITTPSANLDINATGGLGGWTGIRLKTGTSSVQSLSIGQVTAGNGAFIGMAQYNQGGYWQTEGTAAAVLNFESDGTFRISTNSGLTANTNYNITERLRITSEGISCFACQVCAPSFVG
jgi:hypothetical protein